MKQLPKIAPMYYQMLTERAKKNGKKIENYLADLLTDDYTSKR